MTRVEMIHRINLMLGEGDIEEELLSVYLDDALEEAKNWEYGLVGIPEDLNEHKYDNLLINAVVVGYSLRGAEGENQHSEKGLLRGYKYSDMAEYIHRNLVPIARIR